VKILIVKTSAIGDIIQSFPVLDYLGKKIPDVQIDWVVEEAFAGLVRAHPLVRRVITPNTKKWRLKIFASLGEWRAFKKELQQVAYDLVIDLQGNTKSGIITHFANSREKIGFSFSSAPEKLNTLFTTKRFDIPADTQVQMRYLKLVQAYFHDTMMPEITPLQDVETQPLLPHSIMVAFGSKWENKRIADDVLKEFLSLLPPQKQFIFVFGSENEKKTAEALHTHFKERSTLMGNLSFPTWQAVMKQTEMVIAMDSAALHLAAHAGVPTFGFFGPTKASVYQPLGPQHHSIQGACPYKREFSARCPVLRTCPTGACLKSLTAVDIFREYAEWSSSSLRK
jgi:heptosyltransferase-1